MRGARKPPSFVIEARATSVDSWVLALALGGEGEQIEICPLEATPDEGAGVRVPTERGEAARTSGTGGRSSRSSASDRSPLRSSEIHCLIRHEPVARIEGSNLRYPDLGLPVADLGGGKEPAWRAVDLPDAPRRGQRVGERRPATSAGRGRATAQPTPARDSGAGCGAREPRSALVKSALPPTRPCW